MTNQKSGIDRNPAQRKVEKPIETQVINTNSVAQAVIDKLPLNDIADKVIAKLQKTAFGDKADDLGDLTGVVTSDLDNAISFINETKTIADPNSLFSLAQRITSFGSQDLGSIFTILQNWIEEAFKVNSDVEKIFNKLQDEIGHLGLSASADSNYNKMLKDQLENAQSLLNNLGDVNIQIPKIIEIPSLNLDGVSSSTTSDFESGYMARKKEEIQKNGLQEWQEDVLILLCAMAFLKAVSHVLITFTKSYPLSLSLGASIGACAGGKADISGSVGIASVGGFFESVASGTHRLADFTNVYIEYLKFKHSGSSNSGSNGGTNKSNNDDNSESGSNPSPPQSGNPYRITVDYGSEYYISPGSSTQVTATISQDNSFGNRLPVKGKTVEFSLKGYGVTGELVSTKATTDEFGQATVTYNAPDESADVSLDVRVEDQTYSRLISVGDPKTDSKPHITVEAPDTPLGQDTTSIATGAVTKVTAAVTKGWAGGQPIKGKQVEFRGINELGNLSSTSATTDNFGKASIFYKAPDSIDKDKELEAIQATVDDISTDVNLTVISSAS